MVNQTNIRHPPAPAGEPLSGDPRRQSGTKSTPRPLPFPVRMVGPRPSECVRLVGADPCSLRRPTRDAVGCPIQWDGVISTPQGLTALLNRGPRARGNMESMRVLDSQARLQLPWRWLTATSTASRTLYVRTYVCMRFDAGNYLLVDDPGPRAVERAGSANAGCMEQRSARGGAREQWKAFADRLAASERTPVNRRESR